MLETYLRDAAKAVIVVFLMPDVNADGWGRHAVNAVRELQKLWGGKCLDGFEQLWNQIPQTEGSAREEVVAAARSWLIDHFNIETKEEAKELQDGSENIQPGIAGVDAIAAESTTAGLREFAGISDVAIGAGGETQPSSLVGIQEDPQPVDLRTDG